MAVAIRSRSGPVSRADVAEVQAEVVRLIETAVNGPQMVPVLADQVESFAHALRFKVHPGSAYAAVVADQSWRTDVPGIVNWARRHSMFGKFDIARREITLDPGMITDMLDAAKVDVGVTSEHLDALRVFMMLKGLHEIGHALTSYCLRILRAIYGNRRTIPKHNAPVKVGTVRTGKKLTGDAGNNLEELLSGGMRFTYELFVPLADFINRITLVDARGRQGYYVPQGFVNDMLARPEEFYSIGTAYLWDHTNLQAIPAQTLAEAVAHGSHESQWPRVKY
ncbi:hypothetical protein PBRA_009409 [Plasmodiophora brassicae]|uniref:Uncharacterized protein n=1 Tax=Plasmodiophora brassicae TaxID=37360 RepID=A0A0G4J814_PLABS|nr:hypothetical protein PBRA_009409 [Plasmodiophora brassicae]